MFRDRSAAIASPCRALALGLVLALSGATMAAAQQAPAQPQAQTPQAAPATPPALTVQPKWFRLCGKEEGNIEVCTLLSLALAPNNQVFADIQLLEVKGGANTTQRFRVSLPPGALIEPGVVMVIDDQDAAEQRLTGRYQICYPNVCLVEAPLTPDFINRMKRGSNMLIHIAVMGAEGKPQWVPGRLSLAGFTAAYDGAPSTPEEYEAWQKQFAEAQNSVSKEIENYLLRRGEGQREQLQGAQPAAPAPAAPAN